MSTTTTSVNDTYTTAISTTVQALDVTKFALVDSKESDDGLTREAVYQLKSGDVEAPLHIRVGVYKNPKAHDGVGSTNVSVKLVSAARKVDVDDVIWTLPEIWTLAKSAPGSNPFYDTDSDREAAGAIWSMFFNIDAGVPGDDNLDELRFAIPNQMLNNANTAV